MAPLTPRRCALAGVLLGACSGSGESAELGGASGPAGSTTDSGPTVISTGTSGSATSGAADSSGAGDGLDTGGGTFGMPTAVPEICGAGLGPLEIGHGIEVFTALDTQPAELLHGRQGGVHITLGLRTPGLDVSQFGDVELYGVVDGQVVADQTIGAVLQCNERLGVTEAIWLAMVLDACPEDLDGRMIDIEVTLNDDFGNAVSAEASTLIVDPTLSDTTGSDSGSGSDSDSSSGG